MSNLTVEEAAAAIDLPQKNDGTEWKVRVIIEETGLLGGARAQTTKLIYYPPNEGERASAAFDWYRTDPKKPIVTLYHGQVVLDHFDPRLPEERYRWGGHDDG